MCLLVNESNWHCRPQADIERPEELSLTAGPIRAAYSRPQI